jgi:predicted nucleotidyltransferase
MIIQDDLKDLFRLLNEKNVEYVIVGGYAVAFHGYIRATKDIDILFHSTPENITRLMAALSGFGISATSMDKSVFSKPGQILRIGSPPLMVELINNVSGVTFQEIWNRRVQGNYGEVIVPFISKSDLLITKKTAGRPQDIRDVEELES